ncbi:DUF29 domain-containing protein [Planktothrix sp. FACHB-1355]|uniref:DUF29 domain-containing protein n=1 Tax=Aerosakkonema funiforme FACHB-1375 TaxID=2949571 RepID=A0A926ZEP3_9CYAN|nr:MULTISPECIES: DUF29 domain-containing protein [Oscillatoriales]MBD2179975.1 DUF29 domain-containing protein [Aerosakkonema funiforme FACHB-1375]MBD3561908.1 DUF29 domain-containing protein [Planktothrix sp. FACHB-1355]
MTPTQLGVSKSSDLYETDFYAWTVEQAKFLRDGAWDSLDVPNLVEEIESLGKQDRRELRNRLRVLVGHLLKWEYQRGKRSKSWSNTIHEQRYQIKELIKESPSLKPYLHDAVVEIYSDALSLAVRETSLDSSCFPQECPYNLDLILEKDFFPGEQTESDSID